MQNLKNILNKAWQLFTSVWSSAVKLVGSLVLISMILVIIIALTADSKPTNKATGQIIQTGSAQRIAVVPLNGQIMQAASDQSLFGFDPFLITPARTRVILNTLAKDETVKAVVVDLNSPGGSVVASDEIYKQFKKFNQDKPVIFRFSETGASGAYYIACGGEQIVASPATITGSIGVIAYSPNATELLQKIGVELKTFKSGPYKDMGNPARTTTQTEEEIFQSLIDDSYQMFVDVIAQERELDRQKVLDLADGRVYSGLQAKNNGLVDQVGGLSQAIELAAASAKLDNPTVFVYSTGGWWNNFLNAKSGALKLNLLETGLEQRLPSSGLYYLWTN